MRGPTSTPFNSSTRTDIENKTATIEEMAAHYVSQLRSLRPDGPYHLLGWSFGGVVAQAIATVWRLRLAADNALGHCSS